MRKALTVCAHDLVVMLVVIAIVLYLSGCGSPLPTQPRPQYKDTTNEYRTVRPTDEASTEDDLERDETPARLSLTDGLYSYSCRCFIASDSKTGREFLVVVTTDHKGGISVTEIRPRD